MDCGLVDLVGYHFATMEDAERARVDEHLVECTACLRAYLALKHKVEDSRGERPSDEARARLRTAVEARYRPNIAARLRAWLGRPIPLYQGLAAALVAVVLAAVAPTLLARAPTPAPSGPYVDSARPVPESVTFY
jgi:hypothetical protein